MNSASPTQVLRIDFVSDVSCPWCAIGLASLLEAHKRLSDELALDLHFQPFELNPHCASEGEDVAEHLRAKYGFSAQQLAQNQQQITARGAAVGFEFNFNARSRIYNTFDAHRLLHWAEQTTPRQQLALKQALLRAYFTEGRDVSDHATLAAIAAAVGLDAARAREILAGDEYAAETRAAEQLYTNNGIRSVPAIIINRQYLISGGQPAEVFEQALRQIAAEQQSAA